jgi:hypothetical protein
VLYESNENGAFARRKCKQAQAALLLYRLTDRTTEAMPPVQI